MTLWKTIAMDPPWNESGGGKVKRGADRHYKLMKTRDMPFTILMDPLWTPDPEGCHLYMWTTNNFLKDALWLMDLLGFRYITNLAWVKVNEAGTAWVFQNPGLGYYFRGQHELCLFGVIKGGKLEPTSKSIPTVIKGPRREHSRKPEAFYTMAEAVSPGPRLEMFSRETREGWTNWGLEKEKFNEEL